MPMSVTLVSCSRILDQPQHLRPDQRSGDDVAERRPEPEAAENHHEHQRGAEHDRAAFEDRGGRLRGLGGGRHRGGLDRGEQAPGTAAGSRHAATCASAPGRALRCPASRRLRPAPSPSQRLSATSASDTSSWVRPRMPLDQRRRRLTEGAGMDLLRDQLDPAIVVELDGRRSCGCRKSASGARRAHLRARASRGSLSDAASRRMSVV